MATLLLTLVVLSAATDEATSPVDEFLSRIAKQPLVFNGQAMSRVDRNDAQEIIRLRLDEVHLSAEDWIAVEQIKSLESLSLRRTNVTNDDLARLARLPALRWLILTSTEVTDPAVDHLVRIPALKTLCLGDSLLSPAAVQTLQTMMPKLSLGYFERR